MTITVLSPFTTELKIFLKQARARVNKLQKDAVEAKVVGNNSKIFFILTSSVHTLSFPQPVNLTRFHPNISDEKEMKLSNSYNMFFSTAKNLSYSSFIISLFC